MSFGFTELCSASRARRTRSTSSISIVEPAITPVNKYRPRPKLNLLVGLLAGLIFGLAFAFLREDLDKSVKSSDDLEKLTGLPILGMIPRVTKSKVKKRQFIPYLGC